MCLSLLALGMSVNVRECYIYRVYSHVHWRYKEGNVMDGWLTNLSAVNKGTLGSAVCPTCDSKLLRENRALCVI